MSLPQTYQHWSLPTTSSPSGIEHTLHLSSAPFHFPPPRGSTLLVRVHATALNPADYKLAELPILSSLFPRRPATPCLDFSGEVRCAGADAEFRPGTRVFGRFDGPARRGALAEWVAVEAGDVARLPDGVGWVDGACLGTAGQTALQSLRGLERGGSVFVNGASGGVGSYTVQVARLLGAGEVVGTCSGANVQMVRELGVGEVVDYKTVDVREAVKKGEWDLVVDNVGMPRGLHKACDGRVKGRYVQVGAEIGWGSVVEFAKSALLPAALGGPKTPEDMDRLAEWAAKGELKTMVDTVFSFEDAPKAFEKLKTGRARGKIVVSSSDT
ncbi:putative zinc alcohol dehydrogenase [Elsinoe ampelina]|uniref:Putative zinc alcohol dehydrogenase n=1 Tax=Elsinoe ampelina TaxID=302913 RepID=A0A6A6G2T7_9PEZI|nr:putative zinc alcohol dehydrogenase [Elsinoe ampelina]